MDKNSAAPQQDRKFRFDFSRRRIVAPSFGIALTVAWFTLLGYGVATLLDFIAG
jgi:hypothetical protein